MGITRASELLMPGYGRITPSNLERDLRKIFKYQTVLFTLFLGDRLLRSGFFTGNLAKSLNFWIIIAPLVKEAKEGCGNKLG
jgi:hypothetical protein